MKRLLMKFLIVCVIVTIALPLPAFAENKAANLSEQKKLELLNNAVINLGEEHNKEYRKFITDCIGVSNDKMEIPGSFDIHSLNGLVVYEKGQFKLNDLADFHYESQ